MYRDPLARDHAGREPKPRAQQMADAWMQLESVMGLVPVKKNGHAHDRHVSENQSNDQVTPPRQIDEAPQESGLKV
jgi:hypothetical protein